MLIRFTAILEGRHYTHELCPRKQGLAGLSQLRIIELAATGIS